MSITYIYINFPVLYEMMNESHRSNIHLVTYNTKWRYAILWNNLTLRRRRRIF